MKTFVLVPVKAKTDSRKLLEKGISMHKSRAEDPIVGGAKDFYAMLQSDDVRVSHMAWCRHYLCI